MGFLFRDQTQSPTYTKNITTKINNAKFNSSAQNP